jgi:hypothetical protein
MIAKVIEMELNPEGGVIDHLESLEFKVWEAVRKGSMTERLDYLEDELGVLDDMTYWGYFTEYRTASTMSAN